MCGGTAGGAGCGLREGKERRGSPSSSWAPRASRRYGHPGRRKGNVSGAKEDRVVWDQSKLGEAMRREKNEAGRTIVCKNFLSAESEGQVFREGGTRFFFRTTRNGQFHLLTNNLLYIYFTTIKIDK